MFNPEFKYYGNYRARVTEVNIDNNDYGAIRVFIPDLMTDIDPDFDDMTMGLIAYPANNPIGGRPPSTATPSTDSLYQGSVYVPPKGAWVWVFFEGGDPNNPFYWGALDVQQTKLPPENRNVEDPQKVYTIIKTHQGRTICVSDSPDVQRVEITGKKRNLSGVDSAGNDISTYTIDENQTVILIDERSGKEKVLIRTYKGDFINVDVDDRKLQIEFENDIDIKTNGSFRLTAAQNIHLTGLNIYGTSILSTQFVSGIHTLINAGTEMNLLAGGIVGIDGFETYIQEGYALTKLASKAEEAAPEGERDT